MATFLQPPARRRLAWAAGALIVYLLAGFFVVPAVIKGQLLKRLPSVTQRLATVRQVKCNPLTLSLTVRGLALTETNHQPFASFEELYANFQLSSLLRFAWTFNEIQLTEPRFDAIRERDGLFNFANLLAGSTNSPPPPTTAHSARPVPSLIVFSLVVTNGHFGFADLTRKTPFRTSYSPINFRLTGFTTKPDRQSPYSFEASSDNGLRVSWSGTITAQPFGSMGSLEIAGAPLPTHSPYVEDFTRAQLTQGTLHLSARYNFATLAQGIDLVVTNLDTRLTDLELKDPDTAETVLTAPSFAVRGGALHLRQRQVQIQSITVSNAAALVRRRADGTINLPSLILSRLTTPAAPAQPQPQPQTLPAEPHPEPPWIFQLDDYQLQRGSVRFEDEAAPGTFRALIQPLDVRIQHFSTASNALATLQAQLATDAAESLNLTSTYSLNPPRANSALRLSGVELKRYQPYLAPWVRGVVSSGKADLAVESGTDLAAGVMQAALTNAMLLVTDFQIRPPDGTEPVLALPRLAIENTSGRWEDKSIHVGKIASSGGTVHVQREADGSLNLLALLAQPPSATPTNPPPQAPTAGGWQLALGELALREWNVQLTDRQLPKPGRLDVDQLSLALRGAQFPTNAPVATEFSARLNGGGTATMNGSILPYSAAGQLDVRAAGLELRPFQPWLEPFVRLGVTGGTLDAQARLQSAPAGSAGARLRLAGEMEVRNLVTVDQVLAKEFVVWEALALKGIELDLQPNRASVDKISLAGLKTSVLIGPDKKLNLLSILPPRATNSPAPPPEPTAAAPSDSGFPMQIGQVQLDKTSLHFGDQSVQPPCTFDLQQLDGTIQGLSSQSGSEAKVAIAGRVDEASTFALRGQVNPLGRDLALDLTVTNHSLQLTPFSPYMEKYAGHPLIKGRLSVDLRYTVQAKKLTAQNGVRIDQLVLGPRNSSPDATSLPVKLAVALLKDHNGRIDLDLPVEGRLDDPQFRVGRVLLQVMGNLITKAAASPFKLVGALVGGGEELSYVDFPPGEAALTGNETNKLDKLIEALGKRPALNLEIEGSSDPVEDREALARVLVREQVEALRLQEQAGLGQPGRAQPADTLDPAERERLLRSLVMTTCGTNLAAALQVLAERSAAATNAPAPRPAALPPGLVKRFTGLFKPSPERAAARLARQKAKTDAFLQEQNPDLARLSSEDMERLLAAQMEVPPDKLRELRQARSKAVQGYLLGSGKVSEERLFLVAPKDQTSTAPGQARALLALN